MPPQSSTYRVGTIVTVPTGARAVVLLSRASSLLLEDETGRHWRHFLGSSRVQWTLSYIDDVPSESHGPLPIYESAPASQTDSELDKWQGLRSFHARCPARIYTDPEGKQHYSHHVSDDVAIELAEWTWTQGRDLYDFPDLVNAGEADRLRKKYAHLSKAMQRMQVGKRIRSIRGGEIAKMFGNGNVSESYFKKALDIYRERWTMKVALRFGLNPNEVAGILMED
jgi:hypothetical protein